MGLMIESKYWKEELERIAKTLQNIPNPKRWSERAVCVVERDLMIGFFIIRRLAELNKTSDKIKGTKLNVKRYKRKNSTINSLNQWSINTHYDLETGTHDLKSPKYIANQFIHSTISFVSRSENRNWHSVVIVSDYDRNEHLWEVPVSEIRNLFVTISRDYPKSIQYVFDAELNDYKINCE